MGTAPALAAGTWTVDLTTARAAFAARNFFVKTVDGAITVTAATIEIDPAGRPVRLVADLDPATIDTGHPRRDKDLRGKRFLDVAAQPTMRLTASQFGATADGWRTDAVLRVHGRDVVLALDGRAPEGLPRVDRVRITGTARLDLRAAGIRVPGFMVGRYVDITVSAEFIRTTSVH